MKWKEKDQAEDIRKGERGSIRLHSYVVEMALIVTSNRREGQTAAVYLGSWV